LKLLIKKGEHDKAEQYLLKNKHTFQLWVEHGMWLIQIQKGRKDSEKLMD
jgi:hypothetical protein